MRTGALIFVVAILGNFAHAEGASQLSDEARRSWNEACAQVGVVAQSIMSLRLDNTSMAIMMKRIDDTVGKKDSEAATHYADFLRKLVITAYKKPAYQTQEHRQKAIADFKNDAELACFSGGI